MEQVSYLRAFRRHWWVIVLSVMLSVGGVLLIAPHHDKKGLNSGQYTGMTVLYDTGHKAGGLPGLGTVAYFATIEPVAADAAHQLHYKGDLSTLTSSVAATTTPGAGIVSITATGSDPVQVVKVSGAFTGALLRYLASGIRKTNQRNIALDQAQIGQLKHSHGSGTQIAKLNSRIAQLKTSGSSTGLKILEKAVAVPVVTGAGGGGGKAASAGKSAGKSSLAIFNSTKVRLLLGLLLGLALGAIFSLILERYDSRLRTTRSVSRAADLPILAEIPALPRSQRSGVAVAQFPLSKGANSFRILAAAVASSVRREVVSSNGHRPKPIVVLVTSAGIGEGKTLVSANLAAACAEAGQSVILIACDLRRSDLHRRFKVSETPGLVQVLDPMFDVNETLGSVRQLSGIERVTLVASGGKHGRPGELLASPKMKSLLNEARSIADVVVLDTTSLLEAADAISLLPLVDAVVVVARPGRLRSPSAITMGELIHRLRAPSPAIVMNGETEPSRPIPEAQRELEQVVDLR